MDKQREMFEDWFVKDTGYVGYDLLQKQGGVYFQDETELAWQSWQAAQKAQWQLIETAPKDDTVVDLWSTMHGRLTSYYRTDLGNGNVFYEPAEGGYSVVRDATHWMSLPQEPNK